jgi:hypothetical protein
MKIEYLECGSEDCPLIRIYGYDESESAVLSLALEQLASGKANEVAIHELPGFVPVNGCLLTAKAGRRDLGVRSVRDKNNFEWELTTSTWDNVVGLAELFSAPATGFQWLNTIGDVAVLISGDGLW